MGLKFVCSLEIVIVKRQIDLINKTFFDFYFSTIFFELINFKESCAIILVFQFNYYCSGA